MPSNCWVMLALKPCTTDTTAMTEATPIMIPKVVKKLRKPWAKIDSAAERVPSTYLKLEIRHEQPLPKRAV